MTSGSADDPLPMNEHLPSAHQGAEVHEVSGKPTFDPLADHADGIVRMQRLEMRTSDAKILNPAISIKDLIK
jgi:hypothetical protein